MRSCLFPLLSLFALLLSASVAAHELRPVYLQIHERAAGDFLLQAKLPRSLPAPPQVGMPEGCEATTALALLRQSDALQLRQTFLCEKGVAGGELRIEYPAGKPATTTIVQLDLLSGASYTQLLAPGEEHWYIPQREEAVAVAAQYTLLGIEHIWLGLDHLLFVACLLLVARGPRRLLITITGFTAAHSLTLALSTLGWVQLPIAPVEAVIALSILFLACEIARPRAGSWTWRYPVLVSSLFGLLHGFGFASVLGDIGLPQTQLPAALLAFNVGVEIGQLLFVVACLLLYALVGRLLPTAQWPRLPQLGCYLVGTLASFWLFDRASNFLT
ncbi:HupE/UreJ family protein [Microbulbifer pacificus]|uniref:HupE/UreJ family protein n=1 Tax=Microbulbifer pacificus TaxID=407164 RepID=UPI000CF49ACB|nr:HupE/UreJ family protein [Microbulbifer pacificus]